MTLRIPAATATELQAADVLWGYPAVGRPSGDGRHTEIPADWAERIARGETVAGVTVTQGAEVDGSVLLPADSVTRLVDPEVTVRMRAKVGPEATDAFVLKVSQLDPRATSEAAESGGR